MNRRFYAILSALSIIVISITITYAFFLSAERGWPGEYEVHTIVLSLNDNRDFLTINSKEVLLERPGDTYEFELVAENVGISIFNYQIDFGLDLDLEILKAIELHMLNQNGDYQFICMLDQIKLFEDNFAGLLSGSEYDRYDLMLVYSAGAGQYYHGLEFEIEFDAHAEMMFEEQLKREYGIHYITSLYSLEQTVSQLNNSTPDITPTLKLLTDITLDSNINITKKMSFDLNGKELDLNGYNLTFNYTEDSKPRARIYDSLSSNPKLINSGGSNGQVYINVIGGFMEVDQLFINSPYIKILGYDASIMAAYIEQLVVAETKKDIKKNLNLSQGIQFYLANGYLGYTLAAEMEYSEFLGRGYVIRDNLYTFSILQQKYTFHAEINFYISFKAYVAGEGIIPKGDSGVTISNYYAVILGTGAQELAEQALATIPDVITQSLFLTIYNPEYNAYFTWLSSNPDLFDRDGIYLRNGYESLDFYSAYKIRIGVKVEQNGVQGYEEKEVTVVILNPRLCTLLLNANVHDEIVFSRIAEFHDILAGNGPESELYNKTQLISVEYEIDEEKNKDEANNLKLIEIIDGKIVLVNKPVSEEFIEVPVKIIFTYEHGVYVVETTVRAIGYAQTTEFVNILGLLSMMLPEDDTYEGDDFELASKLLINSQNVLPIRYVVPAEYQQYFSIENVGTAEEPKYEVFFKIINLPNKITPVTFKCYVGIGEEEVEYELPFKITGIIHNDIDDIPDEILYLTILRAYDGVGSRGNKDGWLTVHELSTAVDSFTAATLGIKSIKGIQFLTATPTLMLNNNQIVDISPLRNMFHLKSLGLHSNHIVDVSPLANLDNLTNLNLATNRIVVFDSIQYLPNITYLTLSANYIKDYSPLENMTSLTTLTIAKGTGDVFVESSESKYYYTLLKLNNPSMKINMPTAVTQYMPSEEEIIATKLLSSINPITSIYDVLNLVTEYKYGGKTYSVNWISNDVTILNIVGKDYEIIPQIGERDVVLTARITGFAGSVEIRRSIKVDIRSLHVQNAYIETSNGVFELLTTVIPDETLRNRLFSTFNTITEGDRYGRDEKYTLSLLELELTNKVFLNLDSLEISDLTGLRYFKKAIDGLDIRNNSISNPNAAFYEINELMYLNTLYVNNAMYDYNLLPDLIYLEIFSVYGSFRLMDETVLTGLYQVYKRNNNIGIYKDMAVDASNSVPWNPWIIPTQRALMELPSLIYLNEVGEAYYIIDEDMENGGKRELKVTGYGGETIYLPVKGTYALTNSLQDSSGFLEVSSTSPELKLNKYYPYTTSVYIYLSNYLENQYQVTFNYYIEVRLEYSETLKYKNDSGEFIDLSIAFPNRRLRYQILDALTPLYDGQYHYITDAMLATINGEVYIEGGSDIFDESGFGLSPLKGLELLTGVTKVTLERITILSAEDVEEYIVSNPNITSLTFRYTSFSTVCLNPLKDQLEELIFENCIYVVVGLGISEFTQLETFKAISCGLYAMNFISYLPLSLRTIYLYSNPGVNLDRNKQLLGGLYSDILASDEEPSEEELDIQIIKGVKFEGTSGLLEIETFEAYQDVINFPVYIQKKGQTDLITYDNIDYTTLNGLLAEGDSVYLPKNITLFNTELLGDSNNISLENQTYSIYWYYVTSNAANTSNTSQQSILKDGDYVPLLDLGQTATGGVYIKDGEIVNSNELVQGYTYQEFSKITINVTPIIDIAMTITGVIYNPRITTNPNLLSNADLASAVRKKYTFIHGGDITDVSGTVINPYEDEIDAELGEKNGLKYREITTSITNYIKKESQTSNTITIAGTAFSQTIAPAYINLTAQKYYTATNLKDKNLLGRLLDTTVFTGTAANIYGEYTAESASYTTAINPSASGFVGIVDISGIQMFKKTTGLTLNGQYISDITPIKYMRELTTINLAHNSISDVSPLSYLTKLVSANLGFNSIKTIAQEDGYSVFKNSVNTLTTLNFQYNFDLDIDSLAALKKDYEGKIGKLTVLQLDFTTLSHSITSVYILHDLLQNQSESSGYVWTISTSLTVTDVNKVTKEILGNRIKYMVSSFETMYKIEHSNGKYYYFGERLNGTNYVEEKREVSNPTKYAQIPYPVYPISEMLPATAYVVDVRGQSGTELNYLVLKYDNTLQYGGNVIGPTGLLNGTTFVTRYWTHPLFHNDGGYIPTNLNSYTLMEGKVLRVAMSINYFPGFNISGYATFNFAQGNSALTVNDYYIEYDNNDDGVADGTVSLFDSTEFPDRNFSNHLLGLLLNAGAPSNNIFSLAQVKKIVNISTNNRTAFNQTNGHAGGISDITGLKYFTEVTSINLNSQLITELPALNKNNTKITSITLYACQNLKSLNNIRYYTAVKTLSVTFTPNFDMMETDEDGTTTMQHIVNLNLEKFDFTNYTYYARKNPEYYNTPVLSNDNWLFNIENGTSMNVYGGFDVFKRDIAQSKYSIFSNTSSVQYQQDLDATIYTLMWNSVTSTTIGTTQAARFLEALKYAIGVKDLNYINEVAKGDEAVYYLPSKVCYANYAFTIDYEISDADRAAGISLEKDVAGNRYILNVNVDYSKESFNIIPKITNVTRDGIDVYGVNAQGEEVVRYLNIGSNDRNHVNSIFTCNISGQDANTYIYGQFYIYDAETGKYKVAEEIFEDRYFLEIIMNGTYNSNKGKDLLQIDVLGADGIEYSVDVQHKYILTEEEINAVTQMTILNRGLELVEADYKQKPEGAILFLFGVASIKGVEIFSNLEVFSMTNENIANKYVPDVKSSQVINLEPLRNLTKLRDFTLRNGKGNVGLVGVIDISPLESSKNALRNFTCNMMISDISILMGFPALTNITVDSHVTSVNDENIPENALIQTQNYLYMYNWFKINRPSVALTAPAISISGSMIATTILQNLKVTDANAEFVDAYLDVPGGSFLKVKESAKVGEQYVIHLDSTIKYGGVEYDVVYDINTVVGHLSGEIDSSSFVSINGNVLTIDPLTSNTPFVKITARITCMNSEGAYISLERTILVVIE